MSFVPISALFNAINMRQFAEVRQIILARKDYLDIYYGYGLIEPMTPLLCSVVNNSPSITQLLLDSGSDTNLCLSNNISPLHIVARHKLFPHYPGALRDSYQIGQLLLIYGADINAQTADGDTPLHFAFQYGYKNMRDLLLKHDADVSIKNNNGISCSAYMK
jgi:ankyrin repeat protein